MRCCKLGFSHLCPCYDRQRSIRLGKSAVRKFRMSSLVRYAIILLRTSVQIDKRILALSHNRQRGSTYHSHPSSPMRRRYVLQAIPRNDFPFCAEAYGEVTDDVNHRSDSNRSAIRTRRLDTDISAREWMEDIEKREGSIYGIGAYSVLRCDLSFPATCNYMNDVIHSDTLSNDAHDVHWKVWGIDFHMDRLCLSYKMLLKSQNLFLPCSLNDASLFEESIRKSEKMIKSLLKDAANSLIDERTSKNSDRINTIQSTALQDQNDGISCHRTLMLTLLWTPPKHDHANATNYFKPTLRGHACFAGPSRPSMEDHMPQAITACLSIPNDLTPEALALLPHRHVENAVKAATVSIGASAKISSWCRLRRPLEDPSIFKVPGMNVGEVLLVNNGRSASFNFIESLEILEGLTSNVFVIYTDGRVRTAPSTKVLPGYSRYLVMKALLKMDAQLTSCIRPKLVFDDSAPTVQDALSGFWSEVFVTSAIRLLIPVNRIVIPSVKTSHDNTTAEMATLWQGDRGIQTSRIRSALFGVGLNESSVFPFFRN